MIQVKANELYNKRASVTLFAFDHEEEISSHASKGDALVYLLDGKAEVTIDNELFTLEKFDTIVMPAGIQHSLYGKERFKMLLIVIFPEN